MTFHDYPHAMVTMDGKRCVATARKITSGGWLLSHRSGCWVDPRARTQGIFPGKFPHLMHVPTRAEARKILRSLTRKLS